MRKEKSNFENNKSGNKMKKAIIKKITESTHNKINKKLDINRNKKVNLYLNNDSNSFNYSKAGIKTNYFLDSTTQNLFNTNKLHKDKYNNIFLENNPFLVNNKKTRNKIIDFQQKNINQNSFLTRKKTLEEYNNKNIFSNNLNSKRNKNKPNKELMNMSHQSCDEEMSRKFYLNPNYNKIYLKYLKRIKLKNNTFTSANNNTKNNNIKDNFSYFSKNIIKDNETKYCQSYNNGYLSTKDKSNFENTYGGNNSNSIKTTKNTDNATPIITCFSYRNNNKYTYKKVTLSISHTQRGKYRIESYENKSNNNNIINTQKYEGDKLLLRKRIGFKIYKKHTASKSQENIKENSSKYNHLFNKKNIPILKKMDYYEYYKKKLNLIVRIQKWWKDMLFHMYIEQKIICIQKVYRAYLKRKFNKIKIRLDFIYNIKNIYLIQKEWKKYIKKKHNQILANNFENPLPKSIPFKIDNFDIDDILDSCRENKTEKYIQQNNINIYCKKNVNISQRKIIKNNTVSNFYELKKKKFIPKKEINLFLICNHKKENTSALELQNKINKIQINNFVNKYKLCKNISFELINYINENNNNIFHPPIKSLSFIEKEYKIFKNDIFYKKNIFSNNCYISKLYLKKGKANQHIILIQNYIKRFIKQKKSKGIIKPKINICYNSKIRKIMNIFGCSSHNKTENFSFKGSFFIVNSNSNKDKISDIDISNSKSEKTNSYNDKDKQKSSFNLNNNLFSFENSDNKINNGESFQTLLLKDKLNNIFNRYFFLKLKIKANQIMNFFRIIKFIILFKRYINNKINRIVINILSNQILNSKNKNNDIFDEDDIKNIINRKRIIKNKLPSNYLIINHGKPKQSSSQKEYYVNDEEGFANYILNYFYKEKKFTNININLIKERLSKSPLIYRTQDNINNYINDLHQDIVENKICHNCFCKIEENCDIDCSCHNESNSKIKKQKGGISIYRQKINKIIKDNKRNIKTTKTNYDNEKINNNYMFPYLNKNNLETDFLENNNKNTTVNRYDTESLHT